MSSSGPDGALVDDKGGRQQGSGSNDLNMNYSLSLERAENS